MNPTIFYMSGTGNSYYIARTIKEAFSNAKTIDIGTLKNHKKVIESGESIGFVFPCYCHDIPKPYKTFLKKLLLTQKMVYTFAIVTHNGAPGNSFRHLANILAKKKQNLNYARALLMPGNSVIIKNYLSSKEEQDIRVSRVSTVLPSVIENIKNQASEVESIEEKLGGFIQGNVSKFVLNYLYKLPKHFNVNNSCNSCGICERVCSFDNITIKNDKPIWNNYCEACLACFHLCPQRAINLDDYSKDYIRYKHPEVSLPELLHEKYQ